MITVDFSLLFEDKNIKIYLDLHPNPHPIPPVVESRLLPPQICPSPDQCIPLHLQAQHVQHDYAHNLNDIFYFKNKNTLHIKCMKGIKLTINCITINSCYAKDKYNIPICFNSTPINHVSRDFFLFKDTFDINNSNTENITIYKNRIFTSQIFTSNFEINLSENYQFSYLYFNITLL